MKRRQIVALIALNLAVLPVDCRAYVYGDGRDYSHLEEPKLLELVRSDEDNAVWAALQALSRKWRVELSERNDAKIQKAEKKANEELDPGVQKLIDHLKTKRPFNLTAAMMLPFVPKRLAHPSIIAKALNETAMNSKDMANRAFAAIALRDCFWVRGTKLDDDAVGTINGLMLDAEFQKDPGHSLELMLTGLQNLNSDGQPFKDALEKLSKLGETKISKRANAILAACRT